MTHSFHFTKMHGLGNDFIVVNNLAELLTFEKSFIQRLSDRHTGIGFDQLLLIQPSGNADFACRIFNTDGSEAEQCGNGMRCVARYIVEENLNTNMSLTIESLSGVTKILVKDFNHITVDMGVPRFEDEKKIILSPQNTLKLTCLNLGNPHAILNVDTLEQYSLSNVGKMISTHALFPHGVNVGFMEIIHPEKIRLRTYERGAGETLSCGSNSAAAVVAGIQQKLLAAKVIVEAARGQLEVEWAGVGQPVFLTGPAEKVFTGRYSD